jgi:hypothetical protein
VDFVGDGAMQLFYLPHQNIQYILSVVMDGSELDFDEYMYNREYGWIITSSPPTTDLVVVYNQSRSLDMIVTNWDSSIGNYLYYNRVQDNDLAVEGALSWDNVQPGEIVYGSFNVKNIGDPLSKLDWMIDSIPSWGDWDISPLSGVDLTPEDGPLEISVALTAPNADNTVYEGEIVVVNSEDSDDFAVITVYLEVSNVTGPAFNIDDVAGKLGVIVEFSNIGAVVATDVEYTMRVTGGILKNIDKTVTDSIDIMDSGESMIVRSGLFFGLGRITIQFSVSCAEGASKEITVMGTHFIVFTLIN